MRATANNMRGTCDRCGRFSPWVMGSAFQGDGTATFRNLCERCERIEKPRNQPSLYVGVSWVHVETEPEPEPIEETAPAVDRRQLTLF
jgi:hypothetical protein